jgi:CheY-like chemotaxis protein
MTQILVIDDDPQFTDIIKFQLEQMGYETKIAHTQTEAADALTKNDYVLIILDIYFPNKNDGLKLLSEMKNRPKTKNTPIVLATSLPNDIFEQEPNFASYLELSKEFLTKTDDVAKLAQRIDEIIKEHTS